MGLGLDFFGLKKHHQNETLSRRLKENIEQLESKIHQLETTQIHTLAVLESMTEAVIAVDQEERVLFINAATEGLFQIERQKVKGRNLLEAIRNAPLNELILKTVRQSEPKSEEIQMLTPIERVFKAQTAPLSRQGKTIGAVAVLHDVTELKRLERIRKEFVANVSHELKTPLTAIQASVETLLDGAINDSSHNRKFLECIEKDAQRLHNLIEDLLQLSRIESKEIPLKKENVALSETARRAVGQFKKAIQQKNLTVEMEIGDEKLPADSVQLQRAIDNLVDNAIKYNKQDGRILLRARKEENWIRLEVEDTGIGIPEENLPRIFERFYRVDKARSRELGGTGLGLSIVKHIAERHGGRVEVTSRPGQGSCFTLWLPA
ncbi:MAG: PAS domain-containing protein [Candidatus Omnitrophica bacterium]|nr:PAS domain-containing protein [Candidatus Omnitrophota bacterium]